MTTTTTKKTRITIRLSDRSPVTIVKEDWPAIAYDEAWTGEYDFQSFDLWFVRVRRHADGRAIVYGYNGDGRGGGRPQRKTARAGYLLATDASQEALIRAIRRVAGAIGDNEMADRVIADLPAEELV